MPAPTARNASATIAAITLVDMVIFSSCRKRVAFADWIGQGADYSSTCAGTESAWSGSAHFAQQTPIASLLSGLRAAEWDLAASSLSTTYCVLAGTGPVIFQCSNTDRAPDDLVTVGADRGARAVVLKRAGPAGRRTSGRRNGLDNGEQEPESQSNLGQHG
jgi:hypothetical protein